MSLNLYFDVDQQKKIQQHLLDLIENENQDCEKEFYEFCKAQKIEEDRELLKTFLHILYKISKNHYRTPDFFEKIEKILLTFQDSIKRQFSNLEIFELFKRSKPIVLFLYNQKIINFDHQIIKIISANRKKENIENDIYFYPELLPLVGRRKKKVIENKVNRYKIEDLSTFKEKRKIGENDAKICEIIRNDLIDDFIVLTNETNYPLTSLIRPSIYETNTFLIKNKPSLIEYAAFFGSIRIFKYLRLKKVEITLPIFLYAIHSNNAELISILDEEFGNLRRVQYENLLIESIKCHHNDVTNFLLDKESTSYNIHNSENNHLTEACFRYFNINYFPDSMNNEDVFLCACKYDYLNIVKYFYNCSVIIIEQNNKI